MNRLIRLMGRVVLLALTAAVMSAGSASADGKLKGEGEAQMKDTRAGTVTINGEVYHVDERTIIRDEEGNQIKLRRLEVAEAGRKKAALGQIAWVSFDATDVRGKRVLQRIEVQALPE